MNLLLFLLGVFVANIIEYCVHKYLFHGLGKKRNSIFAFHLREHHLIARRNGFVDIKVSAREWIGIPALLLICSPLLFVGVPVFLGLSLYGVAFIVIHNIQHRNPHIAKKYFWWHWNHHMRNQNKSWAVVIPIMDVLTGTLEKPLTFRAK
jgi:hypothetical protein